MSLSAAALQLLLDKGLSLADAVELANVIEAEKPVVTEASAGAARMRRYRDRLASTGMTAAEWRVLSSQIIARDDGQCQYCETRKGRMCCDHVTPLIAGGGNDQDNLVCACEACNGGKSGRSLEEWKGVEWAAAWRTRVMSRDITSKAETLSPPLSPQTPQTPPHTRESITTREAKAREDASFAKFWASYPRKTAKEDARKAFAKAWKALPPSGGDEILAGGLERAKAGWVDAQFIPHAATWLNGKRWQDEADVIQLNPRKVHERPHPHQPTARQDRLGRSLAGLMAAVDEREADVGGRHS